MSESVLNPHLPRAWPTVVRSAMLHMISLGKYAAVYTRRWAADSPNARVSANRTSSDLATRFAVCLAASSGGRQA
jgi:hypothetical protein